VNVRVREKVPFSELASVQARSQRSRNCSRRKDGCCFATRNGAAGRVMIEGETRSKSRNTQRDRRRIESEIGAH
jgi:hypothetical protein